MAGRTLISSGSKWEPLIGYSRAVRVGNTVHVSGTVGVNADGSIPEGAYEQAKRSLAIISGALEQADAKMSDVVRTRIYMTNIGDFDAVAKAHGEIFADIRPATAMVEVSKLVDAAFLVEIEAEAIIA